MAVWLVRAGKYGQDEDAALNKGLAIIGWHEMPDVSDVPSYEEMKRQQAETYPNESPKAVINNAAQLWSFASRIEVGDMAVMPLKTRSAVAVGRFTGGYEYRDGRHVRPVEWVRQDVPRSDFGQDLLYSLGAFMTVCQIRRNNAEQRMQAVLEGGRDPKLLGGRTEVPTDDGVGAEEVAMVDLEEQAFDQIRALIEAKFKGHDLARLVGQVLHAQGYQTRISPAGPDGGVDVMAGRGPMGFDPPRLCVQVKSSDSAVEVGVLRELQGVMRNFGAQQGLLVSWGGFKDSVVKEARQLFFEIRLWDAGNLVDVLLENYERLPDELQAELPLKRIWTLVQEED